MIIQHPIKLDHGDPTLCLRDGDPIAWVHPATEEAVQTVLNAPENTGDGRSNWVWVRLHDGTLVLGVFPQGNTYSEFSDADCAPFGERQ